MSKRALNELLLGEAFGLLWGIAIHPVAGVAGFCAGVLLVRYLT